MVVKDLNERALKGAKNFLIRKGWEILDDEVESETFDIVYKDDDENVLCFAKVVITENSQEGFINFRPDRNTFELNACEWLSKTDPLDSKTSNVQLRYDEISLILVSESSAFLRLHTNILES